MKGFYPRSTMNVKQEEDRTQDLPPDTSSQLRRRRRKRRFSVPAGFAFYATTLLALSSFVLLFLRGGRFMGFAVGSCVLILITLIINERAGFSRPRRSRRSVRTAGRFTKLEVAFLFLLLMFGVFLNVFVWVT